MTPTVRWPPPTRTVRQYRNIVFDGTCNLRCDYCEVKAAKIDVDATIECIDRVLARFDPELVLVRVESNGEITSYPAVLDYLQGRAREGYAIEVLSNGTRLPRCLEGRDDLLWVFSIDGHTEAMNAKRGLSAANVEAILATAVERRADLQCVYHTQTLEEMNGFIAELERRGFQGKLSILPLLAFKGRPLTVRLDYDRLRKADFLPPEEYFRRWEHIYAHGRRGSFVCDQITNGYNYQIEKGEIRMVKCDSYSIPDHLHHAFGPELQFLDFPCGTCLSNQELHNLRPRMQLSRPRLPIVT